ncbi:MAG: DUF971 domain-containing protein [Acidobacteriota bacterium]
MTARPVRIELFPNGDIGIAWDDGLEQFLDARSLRLACPCAGCVDEFSGKRTLDPAQVSASVRAERFSRVGHYALHFQWSDGHTTGLYPFTLLRALAV